MIRLYFKKFNAFLILLLVLLSGAISTPQHSLALPPCRVCKNEASLRCPKCTANYCSANCQKPDWPKHKLEHSIMGGVEIRPSLLPDAGLGLFAKKPFKTGDRIAIYFGEEYPPTVENKMRFSRNPYLTILENQNYLIGKKEINQATEAHLGAQFANDGLITTEEIKRLFSVPCANLSDEYLKFIEDLAFQYLKNFRSQMASSTFFSAKSITNISAEYIEKNHFFIADRDIEAGEEIYNAYGLTYWIGIPIQLCFAHGLPKAALQIQRAASIGTEKAKATHLYEGHLTQEEMTHNLESLSTMEARLTSLFESPWIIQFVVNLESGVKTPYFNELIARLHIEETLEEIAHLPNSEFYTADALKIVHPRSRALFKSIIEAVKSDGKLLPFSLFDGKTGKVLNAHQIGLLLED